MDILKSALVGLFQGLTEFLPVSSSGHIVLLNHYLGVEMKSNVILAAVLHAGTLLATIIVYRRRIMEMIRFLFLEAPGNIRHHGWKKGFWGNPDGRLISLIVTGTLPTVIIGFLFEDLLESLFLNVLAVSMALLVTGSLLYSTRLIPERIRSSKKAGSTIALIIGTVQGLAIIPGISRSGSTISVGMWSGMNRRKAGDFSFLLSIPAITGALILQLKDISDVPSVDIAPLLAGFFVSLGVGWFALTLLLKFIRQGRFHIFSWYCWCLGIVSLILYIAGI